MAIYSPRTLAGGKMRMGIRPIITKLFGLDAPTPISDNIRDVGILFRTDRVFRRDVTRMMKLMNRQFNLPKLAEDFYLETDPDSTDVEELLKRVMAVDLDN